MAKKTIRYKTIRIGAGAVYVFCLWAGGIYATYRKAMHSERLNTNICNHKIMSDPHGVRYIVIRHPYAGNIKIELDEIKATRWQQPQIISEASYYTGISCKALRYMAKKIDKLQGEYPHHAMLGANTAPGQLDAEDGTAPRRAKRRKKNIH